jgi:5-hydroxyisourate hydrolase
MSLSTHVLDAATGRPASGVALRLSRQDPSPDDRWEEDVGGVTDADGRHRFTRARGAGPDAGTTEELPAGVYRLSFATGDYFAATGQTGFYPEVTVTFQVTDPQAHHHVPLLLSPYAFSTYKGS